MASAPPCYVGISIAERDSALVRRRCIHIVATLFRTTTITHKCVEGELRDSNRKSLSIQYLVHEAFVLEFERFHQMLYSPESDMSVIWNRTAVNMITVELEFAHYRFRTKPSVYMFV